MEPYGGLGTANVLNLGIDELVETYGKQGSDFFDTLGGKLKDQMQGRQAELAVIAQDIHQTFTTESGRKVLRFMMEKTLLNPAMPVSFGQSFDELAPWRAGREFENAFVFQLVLAIYQHKQSQGAA